MYEQIEQIRKKVKENNVPVESKNDIELLLLEIERLQQIRKNVAEAHAKSQTKLITERDRLRETLSWYADVSHYDRLYTKSFGDFLSDVETDRGKKAREVL